MLNLKKIRKSIGLQLIERVFAWYFVITLCFTIIHVSIHFHQVRDQVKISLIQYGEIFSKSIAEAMWNYEEDQIINITAAMLELDEIYQVSLIDKGKDVIVEKSKNKKLDDGSFFNRSFSKEIPITYSGDGDKKYLGYFRIQSSNAVVIHRIKHELYMIVVSALFKTTALWLLFIVISKNLLSLPLSRLTEFSLKVKEKKYPEEPLVVPNGDNEISTLTEAFNEMSAEIHNHQIKLEDEVEKKTKDLKVKAEEARQSMEAKSQFLATMSHEIRTPMNGVLGMVEILSETSLDKDQRDYVDTIRNSGDGLLTIINDILDFSKIEANKLEIEKIPFNLKECIQDILKLLSFKADKEGVHLLLDIDENIGEWRLGDPGRIRQILTNLLNNAIKFSPNGTVKLTVNQDSNGQELLFKVIDNGIGISKYTQSKLFKPFNQADSTTTRKFGGTGLGLAISKNLVELMKGSIGVESEESKGATFWFKLNVPVDNEASLKNQEPFDKHEANEILKDKRIFWLEDNDDRKQLFLEYTKSWQADITFLNSLAVAYENLDSMVDSDILILDRNLADGTSFKLIKDVSKELKKIPPCIIYTAQGIPGDGDLCRELGIKAYITDFSISDVFTELCLKILSNKYSGKLLTRFDLQCLNRDKVILKDNIEEKELKEFLEILIVDDNAVNLKVATKMISSLGHNTHSAMSGKEALNLMTRYRFDIIFMDLQMPGLDGFETTKSIRSSKNMYLNNQLPIVALSANVTEEDKKNCEKVGMDSFLQKPFKKAEIRELLETYSKS